MTKAVFKKLDHSAFIADITRPGVVNLLSGDRESGKTATTMSMLHPAANRYFKSVPPLEVLSNVPYAEGGVKGRSMPPNVTYVDSVEGMFREILRIFRKYGSKPFRIALVVDEAHQHMMADNNSDPVNQAMIAIMPICRKFNMSMWFLSTTSTNLVPKVRKFIKDRRDPGNLNYHWFKDIDRIKKYIAENNLPYKPYQFTTIRSRSDAPARLLYVPYVPWMKKIRDLQPGEFAYDDEATATFKYSLTSGFDHVELIDACGGLLKEDIADAVEGYFRKLDGAAAETDGQNDPQREQAARVRRMRELEPPLKWTTIEKIEKTAKGTLTSRMSKYGETPSKKGEASINDDDGPGGGT